MPKCEDCYHYEICEFNLEHQGIDLTSIVLASKYDSSADGCPYFKDKSLIVELPCKVGDNVYLLLETVNGEKEIIESNCLKIYFAGSKIKSKNEHKLVFSMCFPCKEIGNTLEFDLCDFGKEIFLAREEAEKALEEQKMKRADFTINMKPTSISFECPCCDCDVTVDWDDLDVPEYWGDDWGETECPNCGKTVSLGDYDIS